MKKNGMKCNMRGAKKKIPNWNEKKIIQKILKKFCVVIHGLMICHPQNGWLSCIGVFQFDRDRCTMLHKICELVFQWSLKTNLMIIYIHVYDYLGSV